MSTRALPDLIARIRVDSSGVDSAMTNLVGSFGRANLALAGVAAGIGVLVLGGKSMIDISEKHDRATLGLAQAVASYNAQIGKTVAVTVDLSKEQDAASKSQDALYIAINASTLAQLAYTDAVKKQGVHSEEAYKASLHLQDATIRLHAAQELTRDTSVALAAAQADVGAKVKATAIDLGKYQSQIDDFIRTNRRYLSDQSEVIDGYAKLTRSGLSQTEVQRAMNDAVDLAALEHISLADAVGLVDNAEHGRMRGLIDLGITSAKYTDAQGNLILANHSVAKAMDELDAKLKGGRQSLTEMQQASNTLSNDWQDLANRGGPPLIGMMDAIVKKGDEWLQDLEKIGNDNALWSNIDTRMTGLADKIRAIFVQLGIAQKTADEIYREAGSQSGGAYTNPDAKKTAPTAGQIAATPAGKLPPGSGAPYGFDPRDGYAWASYGNGPGQTPAPGDTSGLSGQMQGAQFGGPVLPNHVYTVGEAGPETLVMGASGGHVIPNSGGRGVGGGGGINVYVNNPRAEAWEIANELHWTAKTKRI